MVISLLTVLRAVPWAEVIENAPKVVDGAKKLWKTAMKSNAPDAAPGPAAGPSPSDSVAALEARVESLETAVLELKKEMRESAGLIKALADQNAQLIGRIEANRVRMIWWGWLTASSALVALIALGVALYK
ncbi:hypothetical protein [Geomesophilobacter sediminis]|uniref:Uncharacterized protein n=1 Tax=Geomesophilobacter sediminis TaxID=2798584 RepID=A0A8J7LW93_9BACT|nr:hypothetical protein [Geomesophilobacter sediminis]MBJ6725515.1 hypothetical protein [Geomesophilobacter sediminis]